jgi:hypothetical protein
MVLANETLQQLGEFCDQASLAHLCQTSRRFHSIFSPILYNCQALTTLLGGRCSHKQTSREI